MVLPARNAHVTRESGLIMTPVDDEVMTLGFAGNGFIDGIIQKLVAFGFPHGGA